MSGANLRVGSAAALMKMMSGARGSKKERWMLFTIDQAVVALRQFNCRNLSARAKLAWGIIQESTFDRMGKLKMLAKIAIKLYPAEEKEQARFLARVAQQQDPKASLEGRADMLREMFETVFVEKFKTLRTEEGFHSGLNTFIQEVVDELCRWNPSEGERLAGLIRKPE